MSRSLAELKYEKLKTQVEREMLLTELMKGTIVRVEDMREVVSEMQSSLRARLYEIPAQVASHFGEENYREVMRISRKCIEEALTDLANMSYEEVQARNKRWLKYQKAATEVERTNSNTQHVEKGRADPILQRKRKQ